MLFDCRIDVILHIVRAILHDPAGGRYGPGGSANPSCEVIAKERRAHRQVLETSYTPGGACPLTILRQLDTYLSSPISSTQSEISTPDNLRAASVSGASSRRHLASKAISMAACFMLWWFNKEIRREHVLE